MEELLRPGSIRLPCGHLAVIEHNAEANAGGSAPGIAIFAFGRKEYAYAAQHLALTIKEHSPGIPIHLWASDAMPVDPGFYDQVHHLEVKWYADGPGKMKLNVHDILPEGDWLYLDADTLCLADLGPTLERLKRHDFALDVRGVGKEGDPIAYTPWATNATVKMIAELPEDASYFGVQTSWVWIRKGSELCSRIFNTAKSMGFDTSDLKEQWGGSIPDELCMSAALSKLNHTPFSLPISFYGTRGAYKTFSDVKAAHPLACLYGDTRKHRLVSPSWLEQYDRTVRSLYQRTGKRMGMDIHSIMKNKHVTR